MTRELHTFTIHYQCLQSNITSYHLTPSGLLLKEVTKYYHDVTHINLIGKQVYPSGIFIGYLTTLYKYTFMEN
jgi:hypothetical protein